MTPISMQKGNTPSSPKELIIAPFCEGLIVATVGLVSIVTRNALVFSSLGATAFEQVEKSRSKTARPYNIVVGHFAGIACGFAAVVLTNAWGSPVVMSTHELDLHRLFAATLAVALTVFVNLGLGATQPAACSTSLLVSLGSFSSWRDATLLIGGVIVIALIGEPLRRLRIRTTGEDELR